MKSIFQKISVLSIVLFGLVILLPDVSFAETATTGSSTGSAIVYGGYKPIPAYSVLKKGAPREDVVSLQTLLNTKINANLSADGVYGPATSAAVATFQANSNLVVDGTAGPKTIAALYANISATVPSSTSSGSIPSTTSTGGVPSLSKNIKVCSPTFKPVCGLVKKVVCNTLNKNNTQENISCVNTETRKTYDSLCELENSESLYLHTGKCDLSQDITIPILASDDVKPQKDLCISGYEAACTQNIPVVCVKAPCGDVTLVENDCSINQPVCGAPNAFQDIVGVVQIKDYKNKCQLNKSGASFLYAGLCDATQPGKAISALKAVNSSNPTLAANLSASFSKNVPVVKNAIVAELQKIFKMLGYYTLPIDGVYGAETELAIQKYKASVEISANVIREKGPDSQKAYQENNDPIPGDGKDISASSTGQAS